MVKSIINPEIINGYTNRNEWWIEGVRQHNICEQKCDSKSEEILFNFLKEKEYNIKTPFTSEWSKDMIFDFCTKKTACLYEKLICCTNIQSQT